MPRESNSSKAGSKPASKNGYRHSRRPIGGRGIFVTCIRNKERAAAQEFIELLSSIADELYTSERLAEYEQQKAQTEAVRSLDRAGEGQSSGMDLDGSDGDDDGGDDIETSIAKELAQLKRESDLKDKKKPRQKGSKPRFESIDTETECLLYIATRWPYDPVELTHAVVKHVQKTGMSRTRYTQRIAPVDFICHSSNTEHVDSLSAAYIETVFADWAVRHEKTKVSYQIDPQVRNHVAPLSRASLLASLGASVRALTEAPATESPRPDRPVLAVSADLKNPDLVLLPCVLRSAYGLGIVEGNLWSGPLGKKFNLDTMAAEARKRQAGLGQEAPLAEVTS